MLMRMILELGLCVWAAFLSGVLCPPKKEFIAPGFQGYRGTPLATPWFSRALTQALLQKLPGLACLSKWA